MNEVKFVIPGAAVGKGRPRFARRGGFVSTYTDAKTASFENLVKLAAQQAMGDRQPITGPVHAEVFVFVAPPASWSQKKQRQALAGEIMPTSKPDLDNVQKAIFDACNDITFADDKQVVVIAASKSYGVRAETHVMFREFHK